MRVMEAESKTATLKRKLVDDAVDAAGCEVGGDDVGANRSAGQPIVKMPRGEDDRKASWSTTHRQVETDSGKEKKILSNATIEAVPSVDGGDDDDDDADDDDDDDHAAVSPEAADVGSLPPFVENLGNELVIKIFSYLPLRDLLRSCSKVCRKWNKLSQAPELWRHVTLDVNKLGLKRGMDYRPTLITDDILGKLTSLSEGILSVDLTDCNALSAEAVVAMTSRCPQLRSLNLTRSTLPLDRILAQVAANCRLLESVVLDNSHEYGDDGVRALVSGCRRLWKLSLANNSSLSDAALRHLAEFAPQLKFLSIDRRQLASSGQPDLITDSGLLHLAEGCPNLEQLNISGRTAITAKGFRHLTILRRLKALDMARVNNLTGGELETRSLLEAILAVVEANGRTLDSLNVSILKRIDDDFVARLSRKAKILRQLFILDSTELTDKGLEALADHCLQLSKLDVSWCRKLTDEGVKYLVSRRPTLSLLGLIRCDNVTDACVDQLMESHPSVEFQTFTLGCRQILMRAAKADATGDAVD